MEPSPEKCKVVMCQRMQNKHTHFMYLMIELNPPVDMPWGNVGTADDYFLESNHSCTLTGLVMKKLGLDFHARCRPKKFHCIPHDYNGENRAWLLHERFGELHEGARIMDDDEYAAFREHQGSVSVDTREDVSEQSDGDSGESVDEPEEWERFEEVHGDAHDMSRSGNCMLEYEPMEAEVTWEKGGPGRVLYTDRAFWKALDPPLDLFDEPGNWDFDVDHGEYAGDQDGGREDKKMKRKRKTKRPSSSSKEKRIGKKQKQTIPAISQLAKRLMLRQGWQEGLSLGPNPNRPVVRAFERPSTVYHSHASGSENPRPGIRSSQDGFSGSHNDMYSVTNPHSLHTFAKMFVKPT